MSRRTRESVLRCTQPLLVSLCLLGCEDLPSVDAVDTTTETLRPPSHSAAIHSPEWVGTLATGAKSSDGRPLGIYCDTCHGPEAAASAPSTGTGDAPPFHREIFLVKNRHGNLKCSSCHNKRGEMQSTAHLADQTPVAWPEVVYLCGQCHGPQLKAYMKGVHGGQNGYWDARKGPALRNNCVDCHNPHAPAFPQVVPVPPPRDRYLPIADHEEKRR